MCQERQKTPTQGLGDLGYERRTKNAATRDSAPPYDATWDQKWVISGTRLAHLFQPMLVTYRIECLIAGFVNGGNCLRRFHLPRQLPA
ncbi:MAG: hypothetical protein JWP89_1671 [Schlesneria sp.]|nr:hypothetical protein [Schlesneria sp.]